jgi:pimeloyl-ACP methyl ester carboxylesterase
MERLMEPSADTDHELQAAQAALLARYAPETRVRRVAWSQGETQVLESGAGPPLLLLHGGLDAALHWVPILPALAQDRRVLAVDRPGHGLADPFDYRGVDLLEHARTFLRDILDALELPAVDIVACSMGGLWSAVFALDFPHRVSRIVIAGAPPGITRSVPLMLRLLGLPLVGHPLGRHLMSNPTRDSTRKFFGQMLVAHPERLEDVFLDAVCASDRRNVETYLSLLHCLLDLRGVRHPLVLGKRWQDLAVPTLFLWGERDAFIAPEVGEAIAVQHSNLRLVRLPDAGHFPWIDDPERVVGEIGHFLTR